MPANEVLVSIYSRGFCPSLWEVSILKVRLGLLLVIAAGVFYGAAASDSVLDSAPASYYTEEQVERGSGFYSQHCASCHGNNLQGSASAPPLEGLPFMSYWGSRDALELFEYT